MYVRIQSPFKFTQFDKKKYMSDYTVIITHINKTYTDQCLPVNSPVTAAGIRRSNDRRTALSHNQRDGDSNK